MPAQARLHREKYQDILMTQGTAVRGTVSASFAADEVDLGAVADRVRSTGGNVRGPVDTPWFTTDVTVVRQRSRPAATVNGEGRQTSTFGDGLPNAAMIGLIALFGMALVQEDQQVTTLRNDEAQVRFTVSPGLLRRDDRI